MGVRSTAHISRTRDDHMAHALFHAPTHTVATAPETIHAVNVNSKDLHVLSANFTRQRLEVQGLTCRDLKIDAVKFGNQIEANTTNLGDAVEMCSSKRGGLREDR